jgi:SAM-dependent methyltransferase
MSDPVADFKQRARATWAGGHWDTVSKTIGAVGIGLLDRVGVEPGMDVLDVGTGSGGTVAIPAAQRGANVVGSDLTPELFDDARRRAQEAGVEVQWVQADAEALPFEDARFDCAGSVFGAMLAPRPEIVAGELFRVVRPGGSVGLTAWTPDGVMADMFALGRSFAPPPPGMPLSEQWGEEATARERLEPLASHVDFEPRKLTWAGDGAEAFAEEMLETAPTMAAAREGLAPDRFEALRGQMHEWARRWNTAGDGSLRIEADYAVIVARRRG